MRRRLTVAGKWTAAVLTGLLVVVWVGSAWWQCAGVMMPTIGMCIRAGSVEIWWEEPWSFNLGAWWWTEGLIRHDTPFVWGVWGYRNSDPNGTTMTAFAIPIWSLALLTALPTAYLFYRDRRRASGYCPACNYDLRGAPHQICPECGTPIHAEG